MALERVSTGIKELDELMEGGFPSGSKILLKGSPGSFKTILSLQFLYEGAKKGERGIYITFNQGVEGIKLQAKQLGLDFDKLPVEFLPMDASKDTDIEATIVTAIKDPSIKRVVMDSLSSYLSRPPLMPSQHHADPLYTAIKEFPGLNVSEDMFIRSITTRLLRRIAEVSSTIIFIYESMTMDAVGATCEYLMDGVVKLNRVEAIGKRTIAIEKMRYTNHDFLPRTMALEDKRVRVKK